MPPVFVLIGPPAVGKSSASRALAAHFPKCIHINVDTIRDMVVSGLVLPSPEWGDDLKQQVALARQSAIQMALNYHGAGFTVILDDFYDPNLRADYQPLLGHPDLRKVVIYPSEEEAHRRCYSREGDSPARAYIDEGISIVYRFLDAEAVQLSSQGWMMLDTTRLNPEETAQAILAQAEAT